MRLVGLKGWCTAKRLGVSVAFGKSVLMCLPLCWNLPAGPDTFILDFRSPFTFEKAFAVALANMDGSLYSTV